jgi:hypothetical protein
MTKESTKADCFISDRIVKEVSGFSAPLLYPRDKFYLKSHPRATNDYFLGHGFLCCTFGALHLPPSYQLCCYLGTSHVHRIRKQERHIPTNRKAHGTSKIVAESNGGQHGKESFRLRSKVRNDKEQGITKD